MLYVRPSVMDDVYYVGRNLRAEDVAEVKAAGGTPIGSLHRAHKMATYLHPTLTAVDDEGLPVVMFGVAPHPLGSDVGAVWALGTEGIRKNRIDFLRQSPHWTREFHKRFPILTNLTDCRNAEHHRWLRWCGFSFVRKVPMNGHDFYEFVRIRNDDNV